MYLLFTLSMLTAVAVVSSTLALVDQAKGMPLDASSLDMVRSLAVALSATVSFLSSASVLRPAERVGFVAMASPYPTVRAGAGSVGIACFLPFPYGVIRLVI